MAKRRSAEETAKAVAEVDKLVAEGGMTQEEAFKKVGLAGSVYARHKRGLKRNFVKGSVRADSLPPRPKKKGKRGAIPVNLNDIESVAKHIARLDRKLRNIDGMVRERIRLVGHLVTLLKSRKA